MFSVGCTGGVTLSHPWTFGAVCPRLKGAVVLSHANICRLEFICTGCTSKSLSECLNVTNSKKLLLASNCQEFYLFNKLSFVVSWTVVVARSRTQVSMGILIEQFRSRIKSHDNFLKAKDALNRVLRIVFQWHIMLMMFYLNKFYLPTLKQVVIQYKMWNQVMFWFGLK